MPPRIALVVDDDAFFRMALHTILTDELGCSEVIEAACFDEALERLSEQADISVALFDLSMPGISTPANLKVIRETFPNVRVVVVSASNSRRDVLLALEAGVHGYVPKSLGIAEVTAALKGVFEGAAFVPPFLSEISPDTEESNLASSEVSADVPAAVLHALTPRQQDVLNVIVRGESNKEIARALNLGEGTIKVHVAALFRNLGVNSRAAAAAAGARLIAAAEERSRKPDLP
jgi:DNA-binding NarL/FixJ family response regulator